MDYADGQGNARLHAGLRFRCVQNTDGRKKMYRSAFLGCGGRARGHAQVYAKITRGEIVAICDLDEERLNAFGNNYGVENRYTDIHEMLNKEKPDLLHIVTLPALRVPLMTIAAEHNVPAAIVEKPIAIGEKDFRAIAELEQRSSTKFVVNHQLHFHPRFIELHNTIKSGKIGDVRFLDVSCMMNLSGQGTHVIELMYTANGYSRPTSVFGQVSGAGGLDSAHPAPDMAEAAITFENGARGLLCSGGNAPDMGGGSKRISVHGTRGFVHWQMSAWESSTPDGGYQHGDQSYGAEDVIGQQGLTEAVFDWLDDENQPHPNRLDVSLVQFNIVLGIYTSALKRAPVTLPVEPEDGLLDSLRDALRE